MLATKSNKLMCILTQVYGIHVHAHWHSSLCICMSYLVHKEFMSTILNSCIIIFH